MSARLTLRWALAAAALPLLVSGCAAPPVVVEMPAPRPRVAAKPQRQGFVIAAPEVRGDPHTSEFAAELARRTGFVLLAAPGADGAMAFYAEINANDRRESTHRIEISTLGVEPGLAQRLRALFELIRDAHLRATPAAPRVDVLLTPADTALAGATASRDAMPRPPTRVLRLELPRSVRTDAREPYLKILAAFLTEAATLPAGR